MQTTLSSAPQPEQAEIPGMVATLCLYENWLGPYHPNTLCLLAQLGQAYWRAGRCERARPLLERAVRDSGQYLGRDHKLRLMALRALRDLAAGQSDFDKVDALQKELGQCEKRAATLQ
jgi:hypothetical protein